MPECSFLSLSFPEFLGSHASHPSEELGEGGLVGEVEVLGYLVDGCLGGLELVGGFHEKQSIQVGNYGVARDALHDAREIDGCDVKVVGIESEVAMLDEMLLSQLYEVGEQLFDAFRIASLSDAALLNVHKVEQEKCVEGVEDIALELMWFLLVVQYL